MVCQYSLLYAIHENWHATKLRIQRIHVTILICSDNRTEPTKSRIQENAIFAHTIEVSIHHFSMVWFGLAWIEFMVFNATFNNSSAIWWRSVLLLE